MIDSPRAKALCKLVKLCYDNPEDSICRLIDAAHGALRMERGPMGKLEALSDDLFIEAVDALERRLEEENKNREVDANISHSNPNPHLFDTYYVPTNKI